jgi:putative redox protein
MKASATRRGGLMHDVTAGAHTVVVDEPRDRGGTDTGPTPNELLGMSLASCTAITIEMYAGRKGWEVGEVQVEVDYELDPRKGRSSYDVAVKVAGDLDDEQLERIRVIAGSCPVHRLLVGKAEIHDRVERFPTR